MTRTCGTTISLVKAIIGALAAMMLVVACGTGIETTEHITDKDVARVITQAEHQSKLALLKPYSDSLPSWPIGKQFYVTDNQVKHIFAHSHDYDLDSINLGDKTLTYTGYETGGVLDNRQTINILLRDDSGHTFIYRTGKTIDEFRPAFSIPMLIDLDMVAHTRQQIVGKNYYVKTPIWYDIQTEQMIAGRQFVPVHIDNVTAGNKVMPMRIIFTALDNQQQAMLWLAPAETTMRGRDFDAQFSLQDPHLSYPMISDTNWQLITHGNIAEGMTKDECRLAMGPPRKTSLNPDQRGMREYWYYDGGAYLYFVDGLLKQFRK